jgi:hypothetical protein
MPQNSQPIGLAGWREATSVPTTPRTSGRVAYRTMSKTSSRPAASGSVTATSRTVPASPGSVTNELLLSAVDRARGIAPPRGWKPADVESCGSV